MTTDKKKAETVLKRVEKKYCETLTQVRLQWLRSVYREALEGGYQFMSLGDLIAFVVDHAKEIRHTKG